MLAKTNHLKNMRIFTTIKKHPAYSFFFVVAGILAFISEVTPFWTGKNSLPEILNGLKEVVNPIEEQSKTEKITKNSVEEISVTNNSNKKKDEVSKSSEIEQPLNTTECNSGLDAPLDCKL